MPNLQEGTSETLKEFWLSRWEENDIGWHHEEFNPHLLGFWHNLEIPAGARILVPLSGKSRDMVWLAEHDYRILGVEISPIAVSSFFAERGLEPRVTEGERFSRWQAGDYDMLCGDLFLLQKEDLREINAVYDRASLVALNRDQREAYAGLLAQLLPSGCAVLLVAMDYPQHEMQGPPYCVTEQEVKEIFGADFHIDLLDSLDLIKNSDRYQNRGLSRMSEQIYRLKKR
jgi:thiopurine S-methyltransferase